VMTAPDLYTARKELLDHLEAPVEKPLPPWTPDEYNKQRDWANKAAGLAAQFVAALEEAGDGDDLDRRFTKLANITGMGSPYQFARDDAFQRLKAFKETSAHDQVEQVPISKLVTPILPKHTTKDVLEWKDIDWLVGDVESVLWRPYELADYCARLAELTQVTV